MHEILTLQFGEQSNYLGTHFWNTQESYFTYNGEEESPVDHDIHFRPGVAADGSDTFMPRALIYDLKGGFGSLKRLNALYDLEEEANASSSLWNGATITHTEPSIDPSPYQLALDAAIEPPPLTPETVRFWSDYSRVFFHPRSLIPISPHSLNSSLAPFEKWETGEELFGTLDQEHDLLDRDLRPFLEECDHLQGVQVTTSADDAWGGFASRYVERMRDELGKSSIWVTGLEDSTTVAREKRLVRLLSSARSIFELSPSSSLYIPLANIPSSTPPYLKLTPSSPWHTSALQSAALESLTLPSRLRQSNPQYTSLTTIEASINRDGNRRIARLGMDVSPNDALIDKREEEERKPKVNGNANGWHEEDEEPEMSKCDIDFLPPSFLTGGARGMNGSRRKEQEFGIAEICRGEWFSSDDVTGVNLRDRFAGKTFLRTQSPLLYPYLTSFPSIFSFPSTTTTTPLATKTTLSTSTALASHIRSISRVAARTIGVDEREALMDGLETMAAEYEEGWDDDSDGFRGSGGEGEDE
ncbi:protein DML1 [Aulographum hederae CBS 113979]|uniref:Protein DML1 n=1 Tax=Aulographum hederae CBS 113979 TaxID=1176131 RepID=A0A6G1H1B9_9PEZI|nr:protein DML1 [Aulographum hederae CBS 113979]